MCNYYHPELGGCCFAQKDAPRVNCKGWKCSCECDFYDKITDKHHSRYRIKKLKKDGTAITTDDIIKDDELIFTLVNIAYDMAFDDTISTLIVKSNIDGKE